MSGLTVLREYWPLFLEALKLTAYLSVASISLSSAIGLLLGILGSYNMTDRRSSVGSKLIYGAIQVYVRIFRSIPLLVLLFIIYFGLPGIGLNVSAMPAAALGIGMYYGGYLTEVVRGSVIGIAPEQYEACAALSLNRIQTMRLVIMPQALRLAVPMAATQWIGAVKDTSLASAIGIVELTSATMGARQLVYSTSGTWVILGALGGLYLLLNVLVAGSALGLERWLGRSGRAGSRPPERHFAKENYLSGGDGSV